MVYLWSYLELRIWIQNMILIPVASCSMPSPSSSFLSSCSPLPSPALLFAAVAVSHTSGKSICLLFTHIISGAVGQTQACHPTPSLGEKHRLCLQSTPPSAQHHFFFCLLAHPTGDLYFIPSHTIDFAKIKLCEQILKENNITKFT